MIFYTGLRVLNGEADKWHITTTYSKVVPIKSMSTSTLMSSALVTGVEYFEDADVTVLLVHCRLASLRHEFFKDQGCEYDYDTYKPHITIGKGDLQDEYRDRIGTRYTVGSEYFQIF